LWSILLDIQVHFSYIQLPQQRVLITNIIISELDELLPKWEKEVKMKRQAARYGSWADAGNLLIGLWLVLVLSGMASAEALSETSRDMAEWAKTEEDAERLKCYDKLTGLKSGNIAPVNESAEKAPEGKREKASYFSRLWELDKESRRRKNAITPHQSNYILPFTYNNLPNVDAVREADPDKDLKKAEVSFQLSLKLKLWQDVLGQKIDLWFGYTQRSFWQFYNFEDSSPFRETNYEPEILLNFRTDYRVPILGLKGRFINVSFNHQSNGQSQPLSRSWNRAVVNFGFERGQFSFLLKGWYRIPESAQNDDNPEIEKYLGYEEIWVYYFLKNHRFGLMLRNNLDFHINRGALQVEWSFPLLEGVSGYLQYYIGYGENLLDYNHSVNRLGIGFIFADWN
jgi:phospholipase A1